MNHARCTSLAVTAALLLSGCPIQSESTAQESPQLLRLKIKEMQSPVGRYQLAGLREYPNGSEVYVLDTRSGQVCYYFVANGRGTDAAQKADMKSCAGPALDPSAGIP